MSECIHNKVLPNPVIDLFNSTEKSEGAMMANQKEE
jgi:hypothetical protein